MCTVFVLLRCFFFFKKPVQIVLCRAGKSQQESGVVGYVLYGVVLRFAFQYRLICFFS